ncbi:signal peptidase II [Xiamenia xianingshaonis]|uniref:Lipoprotein signal peptidase n=1 Tax=Xiamenia xianingshaonis TaxID=2682776 RepID=A0A9E6MP57_9ACTN|nr:signal peptidase II [Xiamenia xianingshaonis]NHM13789.1 signal peptidase II [Xiamenia xianingshaonis]QTU83651.1 signal peptidase II [Xiamenia xianingshaonis]
MALHAEELTNESGRGGASASARPGHARGRVLAVIAVIAAVWVALDQATKAYFNSFDLGAVAGGPFAGLVQFRLVHNTGMAWGLFGDSTFALGVMSVAVCCFFAAYAFICAPRLNWAEVVGLALVIAGGIGNACDRFTQGYVVDFIETVFMDFPVFNIADIGVTCGFVLFLIGLFVSMSREGDSGTSDADGFGADAPSARKDG